jgi:uncharacterized phage protein (TIGR01671 family)
MRELKFRAWDKQEKKYWHDIQTAYDCNYPVVCFGQFIQEPMEDENGIYTEERRFEVEQFTGLQDKNGKEIYENDITNKGIVKWFDAIHYDGGGAVHPGFYLTDKNGLLLSEIELSYPDGFYNDIEVLGNIHENPELLT